MALEMSDGALLEGLRRGDDRAYGALFERHWTSVYSVLYRLVGSREEAEDLAQEVFLKLHRQPLAPDREHNLPGWLYRVATNLGYNALRSNRRRLAREGLAEDRPTGAEPSSPPLEAAVAAEERAAVRAVLATLSERHQACLMLRYEGLSYAEIAAAIGVAPGSVGTILSRAEAEFKRRYLNQRGGL